MKKYITLFLFVIISAMSYGQGNYQDVVYLKNGSIIRGIIIEQVPNKSIKIETVDRNVFVYQMDEIEKLTKEIIQGKIGGSLRNSGLKTGYKGIVEFGYEGGIGNYGMDRMKLNIINGYQINPYFSLGLGTGLKYYFDEEAILIPLFADFRANFMNNKVSPYLSLGLGYTFVAINNFSGLGFLLNPNLGVSFKVSDKSAMNIGMGYEMQSMQIYDYFYGDAYVVNTGAISLNFGFTF